MAVWRVIKNMLGAVKDLFTIDYNVSYTLEEAEIYQELERVKSHALAHMPPIM